ncbi:DUF6542 domain-containing protein [Mycobacterium sp. Z3061]|uniref:DUF6542 domain-containing protein n=1 Tax=Mycobacterium sp. Z3061 TaxID=3073562 RepID=UPI00287352EF|nr:DUF6542 domain-containing protein [Mycobacterium sp. Z3061]
MSAQRERAAVEPSHRSIVPTIPGVPWWAAVLIAVGATALGYAFDAGHKELTHTFASLYIAGCVAAVLAVRQAAVFTAVIQPPLILFCTVPGAYWLFHGGKVDKFKDLLINCGYPLIERFPLMLGTAGVILLIGLIRWYFGKNSKTGAASGDATSDEAPADRPPLLSGFVAKLSSLLAGDSYDDADADAANAAPPAHSKGRAARSGRTTRSTSRTAQRPARSRSRHARPDDSFDPAERPRRSSRRSAVPSADTPDYDRTDLPPRRRRRPEGDSDLGAHPPRELRREPHPRRSSYDRPRSSERPTERPYERPEPRSTRFNPYDSYDRPASSERGERRSRHERRGSGYEPYPPYEPPYEPRSRRTNGSNGANPTHHPISQVRYRGEAPRSEPRDDRREEPRSDRRSRPRAPRRPQTEPWE